MRTISFPYARDNTLNVFGDFDCLVAELTETTIRTYLLNKASANRRYLTDEEFSLACRNLFFQLANK